MEDFEMVRQLREDGLAVRGIGTAWHRDMFH